jgi:hypothetical protein
MPRSDAVWKMVPTYLFWCLWRERNDRNFKDREDAKGNFIVVLWTAAYVSPLSISYSDFFFYK